MTEMWLFLAAAVAVFSFSGSRGVAEAKCVVAFDGDPGTDTGLFGLCEFLML